MKKRVWALLLAAAILAVLLSACGAETPAPDTASVPDSGLAEAEAAAAEPAAEETEVQEAAEPASIVETETEPVEEAPEIEVSYPLTEEDITFDYMNREYPLVTSLLENEDWNNHLLLQEAEKITGVKINYIPVAAFNTGEVYSLSFDSGDLADIY